MTKRIGIEYAGQWLSNLAGEMRTAAEAGLFAAAIRVVGDIQTRVIPTEPFPPSDKGVYRAGWRAKRIKGGALIYNDVPYASIIEYGARGKNIKVSRKMIEALAAWVQRKGLVSREEKGRLEATAIAWAIVMTMKKRGIFNGGRGLRILEKALTKAKTFMREEVARELQRLKMS